MVKNNKYAKEVTEEDDEDNEGTLEADEVRKLFGEGYFGINCESCSNLIGFIMLYNTLDYRFESALCPDCSKKKLREWKNKEDKLYS